MPPISALPQLPAPFAYPAEGADQSAMHVLPDSLAHWSRDELVAATGGQWIVRPPSCWHANGVAITPNRVRPGVLLCHAPGWFPLPVLRSLTRVAAGIICQDGSNLGHLGLPILEVADMGNALADLARHARNHFSGKVIALTGSVGKTGTSYLLGKVLSGFGQAEHTLASGNSPRANACLLASISRDIPFWIAEVALNDPARISSFTRPHIAIVLAISAAHLVYWKDTHQVALRKSAIFSGMDAGGHAILNRDMLEYETVAAEAEKKGLNIVAYGKHASARFRLLEYAEGKATVSIDGATHRFACALPPHLQTNMLAILATVQTLGYPVEQCFAALEDPDLLPGRGRRHRIFVENKHITVIDDSYNANPDSMRAALQGLCFAAASPGSRVAILGDIAELGNSEVEKHLELTLPIKEAAPDRLLLCGPLMRHVWNTLAGGIKGKWFATPEELRAELTTWLQDGDTVMFKSSGHKLTSTVMHLLSQHRLFDSAKQDPHASTAAVAIGGNINLGRRMHIECGNNGYARALGAVSALHKADAALATLNCVAAMQGQPKVDKGVVAPTYFRARPEQLEILRQAGIRMVATANYHSGDYGREALCEQLRHLDAMGIQHAGSGASVREAGSPAYVQVRHYTMAVFSVDSTMPVFAADPQTAGNWHLPLCNPDLWYKETCPRIAQARKTAHTVIFVIHGNINTQSGPGKIHRGIAHAVINAGADAVFFASPQTCPALETYNERPIIYGAGDLLTDVLQERFSDCGLFTLTLSPEGISKVRFLPLLSGGGRTVPAEGEDAARGVAFFAERSRQLGTEVIQHSDTAGVDLWPQRRSALPLNAATFTSAGPAPAPSPENRPRPEWIMREIDLPAHLSLTPPLPLGPLMLRGCWVPSSSRQMRQRQILWLETYWSIREKIDDNLLLDITVGPREGNPTPRFGEGMRHDPCDWMWPTNRWEPGIVYKDVFGLLPPAPALLHNAELAIRVRVLRQGKVLGTRVLPLHISLTLDS